MKLNGTLCTCKNQYLTKIFSYEKKTEKRKKF